MSMYPVIIRAKTLLKDANAASEPKVLLYLPPFDTENKKAHDSTGHSSAAILATPLTYRYCGFYRS